MKNILFYYISEISPLSGGVERVVATQYQKLTDRGYQIYTIYGIKLNCTDCIPKQYQLPIPDRLHAKENILFIQNFIQNNNISLVLNFAALFNKGSVCVVEACKGTNVPIISVIHNTMEYLLWKLPLVRNLMKLYVGKEILHGLLKVVHRLPFYKGGLYIYKNAAATVVLSPCYIDEYKSIITRKASNLYSIYNPSPIKQFENVEWDEKQPMVLFVGRLEKQKSVEKLIRIWAKLNDTSWRLCIVGSGSQEQYLKDLACKLQVSDSISFEGHQSSFPYYKNAKIFCLTSIYEGYPMTIIECQSYGVVPVIYDSFLASHDMITSGKDGIIVSSFVEDEYVEALRMLMNDGNLLKSMSENSLDTARRYSVEEIIDQWVKLIEKYRLH